MGRLGIVAWLCLTQFSTLATGQNVTIATPASGLNAAFSEQIGVGFQFRSANAFFQFGPLANPANTGIGFGFGAGRGSIRFFADQGSQSGLGFQSPMITLPQGGTGFFFNGIQTPFVTAVVPIVGSPVQQAISRLQAGERPAPLTTDSDVATQRDEERHERLLPPSSAERSDVSVLEIRRQRSIDRQRQARQRRREVAEFTRLADQARRQGKFNTAALFERMAHRLSDPRP